MRVTQAKASIAADLRWPLPEPFLEVAAVIVHHAEDRLAERTALAPRAGPRIQISERKVAAPHMVYRADQAKAPVAVAQLASVTLPAAVEELLGVDQVRVGAADHFD